MISRALAGWLALGRERGAVVAEVRPAGYAAESLAEIADVLGGRLRRGLEASEAGADDQVDRAPRHGARLAQDHVAQPGLERAGRGKRGCRAVLDDRARVVGAIGIRLAK